jgi:hypothetical protein
VPDDRRRKLVAGKRDRHAPSYQTDARYRSRDGVDGARAASGSTTSRAKMVVVRATV